MSCYKAGFYSDPIVGQVASCHYKLVQSVTATQFLGTFGQSEDRGSPEGTSRIKKFNSTSERRVVRTSGLPFRTAGVTRV